MTGHNQSQQNSASAEIGPALLASDDALNRLIDACHGVPFLATCIYETVTRAGLRLTDAALRSPTSKESAAVSTEALANKVMADPTMIHLRECGFHPAVRFEATVKAAVMRALAPLYARPPAKAAGDEECAGKTATRLLDLWSEIKGAENFPPYQDTMAFLGKPNSVGWVWAHEVREERNFDAEQARDRELALSAILHAEERAEAAELALQASGDARAAVIEECLRREPQFEEDPIGDNYQRGRTDGIKEYSEAIRALQSPATDAAKAAGDDYQDAIDEALVVRHLGIAKGDARGELNQIVSWEVAVALDPRVSEAAQTLIDQGRASGDVRAAVIEALFSPRESNAIDNLEGALFDINRLSGAGEPTDKVCIRTLERIQRQLVKAHRAIQSPATDAPGGQHD